jgi:hypothetical protein
MTEPRKCAICHNDLMDTDRVIFSHKETFVFKPADVPDIVNPAKVTPAELAESRKEHLRTSVVNTFCDWGKATLPADAFNFRHQWCEPVRTASGVGNVHAVNKHAIRFGRAMPGRLHGKPA